MAFGQNKNNRHKLFKIVAGFSLLAILSIISAIQIGKNINISKEESKASNANIEGELIMWYPLSISFEGQTLSQGQSSPNPFLDFRLQVLFTSPSGKIYNIPGFYDGDGKGGTSGNIWKVRFSPDEAGEWEYKAYFQAGENVALSSSETAGTSSDFNGEKGNFVIKNLNTSAPGFLKWGLLEYVNDHYLKFRHGPYFIKGGVDSPENILGYNGFINTKDTDGSFLHKFGPHVESFKNGDPVFSSNEGDSKGIIGMLNYLSSEHVNSIYFLPMNLGGDAKDTYPFISPNDKTHYDVAKLDQWNTFFEHATEKGIMLHFVLAENEEANAKYLDNGSLGTERKLFYRELIARFGHNLAIKWNIQEENTYSVEKIKEFAGYIQAVDPYDHPITTHTWYNQPEVFYNDMLGTPYFSATSIQYSADKANDFVEQWRTRSKIENRPWVIDMDENATDSKLSETNASDLRKKILYPVYFSGGNIEWYMEPDQKLEDFSTRSEMWKYMWYARKFMEENLPFWEMEPMDNLLKGENTSKGEGQVFAKLGKVYAIYLPKSEPGKNGRIDLSALQGKLTLKWYNPRKGAFEGTPIEVEKTSEYTITSPPSEKDDDWVILISDGVFNQNYYYDDRPVPVTITSSPSVGKYYIAKNNILVVDFESHDSVLGWKMSSDHEGYTSDGYLLWQGGNHYDDSSWGNMEFNFMISTEGNYKLNIHNYHEGPDASEKNDVWVKMDNGVWNKVFSSEADKWNWSTNFDLGDSKPAASFDLSKGMHTIYFAGRSQGFGADRFHLYIDGYESALDLKIPNSQLVKSEVTPTLTEENTPSTVATVWPTFKKDPDSVMCGAADINGDNVIDLKDFKGFKDVYNKTCLDYPEPTGCGGKDFVYDGVINIKDFSEWSKLYGEPCE